MPAAPGVASSAAVESWVRVRHRSCSAAVLVASEPELGLVKLYTAVSKQWVDRYLAHRPIAQDLLLIKGKAILQEDVLAAVKVLSQLSDNLCGKK